MATKKPKGNACSMVRYVILFLLLTMNAAAFGQSYKAGRASLMKSDYKKAESQLTGALKSAKSKAELAETYKYLGVAQYMSGNKAAASASFVRAKAANPSVKLTASEVADESVIPVFNASNGTQRSAALGPRSSRGQTSGVGGVSKQKSKRTLLKVVSNVPSAQVSLDGIAYGTAGQDIEVQPGAVVLEVSANGYKTKAVKVQLDALTTSSVTVDLEKIPPKPKPLPAQPQAPRGIPLPGNGGSIAANKKSPGASAKKSKNDLFGGDDGADDFTQYQRPAMPPQPVIPPAPPSQPVMPPQGYGITPYAAQPAYPQSPYPQSPYPQSPYAQQPYPIYQPTPVYPAYPSYPMYQSPAYGPSPYPAQPYGGYGAPPVNPYAYSQPAPPVQAPSPSYSAPADPYGGYLGPPPESPSVTPPPVVDIEPPKSNNSGGGMPPPPILAPINTPRTAKKSAVENERCSALIKILPFGFGQFCKGSAAKGAFFLGSEVGALYFYKANTDAAASFQTKLNSILLEREAARADVPADEQEAFDAETAAKETQGKAAISKAKQNAQYSILAFVGLWGAGAVDAMISPTPGKSSKSKKSKKRSPRIIQSYNLDLETAPIGTLAMDLPFDRVGPESALESDLMIGYTPIKTSGSSRLLHAMTVGVTWDL